MENEKRLIDANEFVKQLEEEFHGMVSDSELKVYQIISRIEEQPTEDAVEVVRCKDCKWYAPNNEGSWIGCAFDTRHPDDVPKADDFCSYGERKDNG